MKTMIIVLAAIILLIPNMVQANEIVNSDFETGFATPWAQIGFHTATSPLNGTAAHSGNYGLQVNIESPVQGDGWGGFYQNFAANPGEVYQMSAWANTQNLNSLANASLQIAFFNVPAPSFSAVPIADVNTTAITGQDWTQLSLTTPAAPAGTVAVRYVLASWANPDSQFPGTGSVYWDDVSGDIIPEPSSLLLLGSGIIGMLTASRKKKRA